MKNQEIANIFYKIADFLEMEGIQFKPAAYRKAALILNTLEKDVKEVYKEGDKKALEKIPGVGKNIAKKIEEYLKLGRIKYYEKLKKKIPVALEEMIAIEGIGPKTVKTLYQKLKIRNLTDLERAAKGHKISTLFGFSGKTEKNILEGIRFLKRSKGRFLLGDILPQVKEILKRLRTLKEISEITVAGSIRRMKETVGDVDILITVKENRSPAVAKALADKVMDYFCSFLDVVKIWGKGSTRSSIRVKQGFDIDLRVVPEKSYGSALQYFTGSKEHNIITRRIAIEKGLKLNEYGMFKGKKMIAGRTEREIYKILGMKWMIPELRENTGEIEAALAGRLPSIINLNDIKGDLHCHSKWDGGANTIEEMAIAAIKMNYEYLGITDHTKFLKIEHGLNERQLSQQRKEINKLNSKFSALLDTRQILNSGFRVLHGAETNILNDGSIDINDKALKKLDYAIAGIHSNLKMSKNRMTERIIKAMKNPYIKILSHPTGRILKKRDECQIDFGKVLRAAKEFGVVLEINSQPVRLDLNDKNIKRAKEAGVKMVINTDSHHQSHLRFMDLGVAQARRGWAEKKDIINTLPFKKLLKRL